MEECAPRISAYAVTFARKYHCLRLTEDLEAAGILAFWERIHGHDEEKGSPWTYLKPYVHGAMQDTLEDLGYPIRLPHQKLEEIRKAHAIRNRHLAQGGDGGIGAVAGEMGISSARARELLAHGAVLAAGGEQPDMDRLVSNAPRPDQLFWEKRRLQWLEAAFASLSHREQEIVGGYFGALGHEKRTLAQLGEEFDLTEKSARNVRDRAIVKMREYLQRREIGYLQSIPGAIRAFPLECASLP